MSETYSESESKISKLKKKDVQIKNIKDFQNLIKVKEKEARKNKSRNKKNTVGMKSSPSRRSHILHNKVSLFSNSFDNNNKSVLKRFRALTKKLSFFTSGHLLKTS